MTHTYGAILAAGLGTRLRPLTNEVPKPSLPICGRPLLEYGVDLLERAGVSGVGVNVHYQAAVFADGFESRAWPITVSHEEELLGTGGGLKKIAGMFPRARMISINGDALLECDLAPILERHIARGAMATMVLRRVPADSPFARVGHDEHDRIYQISEVGSPGVESRDLTYSAYTGVQIVEPTLLDMVDDGPCDVIRTGYRKALATDLPIYADFVDGLWLDVGTPERYFEANMSLARLSVVDKRKWRLPQSAVGTPDNGWIHPQTSIGDDVQLGDGVVINKPSLVRSGVSLNRVVCSTAADLRESLDNAIAYQEQGVTHHIVLR